MSKTFSVSLVEHIATLSDIPISDSEAKKLSEQFNETLEVIDKLQSVDVSSVEETHQVTGLTNIWREDLVNEETMFTQKEALANAKKSEDGYFVIDRILHNE